MGIDVDVDVATACAPSPARDAAASYLDTRSADIPITDRAPPTTLSTPSPLVYMDPTPEAPVSAPRVHTPLAGRWGLTAETASCAEPVRRGSPPSWLAPKRPSNLWRAAENCADWACSDACCAAGDEKGVAATVAVAMATQLSEDALPTQLQTTNPRVPLEISHARTKWCFIALRRSADRRGDSTAGAGTVDKCVECNGSNHHPIIEKLKMCLLRSTVPS